MIELEGKRRGQKTHKQTPAEGTKVGRVSKRPRDTSSSDDLINDGKKSKWLPKISRTDGNDIKPKTVREIFWNDTLLLYVCFEWNYLKYCSL